MATARLFPHRRVSPRSLEFGPWWHERSGHREQLPNYLAGWDYTTEWQVGISLTGDIDLVLEDSGHASPTDLEIRLTADCAATGHRLVSATALDENRELSSYQPSITLPAGKLADSVKLTAHLVVARDLVDLEPMVASNRGARLISCSNRTVYLEGTGPRFPTSAVSFDALGLPDIPWTLRLDFASPEENFMNSVRLLVNADHPVGQAFLEPETVSQFSGAVASEILRVLVGRLAADVETFELERLSDTSVGGVVRTMCEVQLKQDLPTTITQYLENAIELERTIHQNVRPIRYGEDE